MDILVGADPEFFVVDKEGTFQSAHGLIPGTKENPFPVNKGAVQVDGMALEFNIDPASSADEFVTNINTVLGELRGMVSEALYDFAFKASVNFSGAVFKNAPDEAKELGCTPDYNAYTLLENDKPDNTTTLRTASGHVHIGFGEPVEDFMSEEHMLKCAVLVKQLDFVLGLSSFKWDTDKRRRTMSGKAGCFRPKPYGLEYRVLSNAWLCDESRMRFIFDATKFAVDSLLKGNRFYGMVGEDVLRKVIDTSDKEAAFYYINSYGKALKPLLAGVK